MFLNKNWLIDTFLIANAVRFGNFPAIIGNDTDVSHQELHLLVEKVSLALESQGIDGRLTIGLRFKDPIKHLVVALALMKMRVTHVSLNVFENASVQQGVILACSVDMLIEDLIKHPPLSLRRILITDDYQIDPDGFVAEWPESKLRTDSLNQIAMIFPGSGTTGAAKIISVNFSLLSHLIERDLAVRDFRPGEKHYCPSSINFYTTKRRTLGCLASGVIVMLPTEPPVRLVSYCIKNAIQHLSLTTTDAINLLKYEADFQESKSPRLPDLKTLFVGSSFVSESLRHAIRSKISSKLYVVYGSNEFGEASIAAPEDQEKHLNTVGASCAGVTIDIVDDAGNFCPQGIKGHVRLKSALMMEAYMNDPEASARSFTSEGYYPGDMGSLTEDGNLVLDGRRDDMMIYWGVNIYPREIESVLESHSAVAEAAAFPLFDDSNENIPFAVVRVITNVSEQELLAFCAEKLGWRRPRRIMFSTKFPRNAAGKVLKQEMAKNVLALLPASKPAPPAAEQVLQEAPAQPENPARADFAAKVQWRMFNDRNPVYPVVTDKIAVKNYAMERGVATPKLLYQTTRPAELPFDQLPQTCFIKANNGCGWNILRNKGEFYWFGNGDQIVANDGSFLAQSVDSRLSSEQVIDACQQMLVTPYKEHEWAYHRVTPRILVEEQLEPLGGGELFDYRFYTFNGVVRAINVGSASYRRSNENIFLTTNWEVIALTQYRESLPNPLPGRPVMLAGMLEAAQRLGYGIDFVRIDLYQTNKGVMLGEMTLYPEGGQPLTPTTCPQFNYWLGDAWIQQRHTVES